MREIDRVTSERFGVASLTLMENAGTAVADFLLAAYPNARKIAVICGKGNNGGDGFVAARKLSGLGREAKVLLLADPGDLRGDAAEMFKKMGLPAIVARSHEELEVGKASVLGEADLIVDAVLGTGFRPPVSGIYAEAIAVMNASGLPIVAVDIPSGADADAMGSQSGAVVCAHAVVTFTAPRPAHVFGALTDGPTVIAPIGSPEEAVTSSLDLNLITPSEIAELTRPRPNP